MVHIEVIFVGDMYVQGHIKQGFLNRATPRKQRARLRLKDLVKMPKTTKDSVLVIQERHPGCKDLAEVQKLNVHSNG